MHCITLLTKTLIGLMSTANQVCSVDFKQHLTEHPGSLLLIPAPPGAVSSFSGAPLALPCGTSLALNPHLFFSEAVP